MKYILTLLVIALLIVGAFVLFFQPFREVEVLRVAILNKTVPDTTYREHKGVIAILDSLDYSPAQENDFELARDYYGFFPIVKGETYDLRPLPDDLTGFDLVYIADAYGVYLEEWFDSNPLGKRSPEVYGGLESREIDALEKAAAAGVPIIAEFNTFASPTTGENRERASALFGVKWTGWAGRPFNDMADDEVPIWAKRNWEAQNNDTWHFAGPGMIYANEADVVVVFDGGTDLVSQQPIFQYNDTGARHMNLNQDKVDFGYWMDINEVRPGATLLGTFRLEVTDSGYEKLKNHGIPMVYPALVMNHPGNSVTYYLCGESTDVFAVTKVGHRRWFPKFERHVTIPVLEKVIEGVRKGER